MDNLEQIKLLGEKLAKMERFNSLIIEAINTSHEGIALLDEHGNYIYMNKAHEVMFGYTEGELIGKSWTTIYSNEDIEWFSQNVFPIIEKEGKWNGEATAIGKHGNKIKEVVYLTALSNGGLICTCRDKNFDNREWTI